jgi:hypothetical protein
MTDRILLNMKNLNRMIMILTAINLMKKAMIMSLSLNLWKIKNKAKQTFSIKITWIEIYNLNRILIKCQVNWIYKTEHLLIIDKIIIFNKTTISVNKDMINMNKKKYWMLNNKIMSYQVRKQKWQRCKMMKELKIL